MIIQIGVKEFLLITVLCAIIQFLIALWIKTRLKESIKHEYDKNLEDYRFSFYKKEQASKIATFFAKWAKYNAKEKEKLIDLELRDYYEELTKMSYELSLWIKDEKLVKKIMKRLILAKDALSVKELLIEIRELIHGQKCKHLKAEDLVHWSSQEV